MICSAFERWLDDGRPDEGRAAADAHAAACPACARQLGSMDELESLLSSRFAAAPTGLTDRVMEALPPRPAARVVAAEPEPDFPWWVRLVQEPMVAASLVAAAGLLAAFPALVRLVADWTPHAQSLLQRGAVSLDAVTGSPVASLVVPGLIVLVMAAAPLLMRAAAAAAGDSAPGGDLQL